MESNVIRQFHLSSFILLEYIRLPTIHGKRNCIIFRIFDLNTKSHLIAQMAFLPNCE